MRPNSSGILSGAADFRRRQSYGGQVVAPRLQISLEYAPSSRLAIRPAALAIPYPINFQNTL
jgi:hypothetical protein